MCRISQEALEGIFQDDEKDIVDNESKCYKEVAKVANRILKANKDIPGIFGKDWTIILGRKKIYHD